MNIESIMVKIHEDAVKHGFWEDYKNIKNLDCIISEKLLTNNAIGNMLMLIVSEVAEAQEGLRKNDEANFKEELADVAIRLFDMCEGLDIELEAEIAKKMAVNKDRPYKHNKAF